jgi:hypothetical protein
MLDAVEKEDSAGFTDLLAQWREAESVGTDDVLAAALPLIRQTADLHDGGWTAPLNGVDALRVSMGHLWFPNAGAMRPELNPDALRSVEDAVRSRLDVTGNYEMRQEDGGVEVVDASVGDRSGEGVRLAYYSGYASWEHRAGHHDPLTDIFVLGLVLGSLATRLDLSDEKEFRRFVASRGDLIRVNPRLHPVVSQIIEKMTELDRRKRPGDLRQIANALANYREQDAESRDEEEAGEDPSGRPNRAAARQRVHGRLRDRLFEINRRNRLIYFRETRGAVNLTVASAPNVLDHRAIKPEQLFCFNEAACKGFRLGVDLGRWIKFEEYEFLSAAIDRIRLEAQRDAKEYGFSQLRLVAAFLRWTNLKEAPRERINSPLILLPATITRRKGVKDSLRLEADPSDAEINPALRYYLRKLYDIRLPDLIDASNVEAVRELHADLVRQLSQSAKGVELALVETPRIQLIHRTARRRLDDFRRGRRRTGAGVKDYEGLAYSYSRASHEPLGVQIFERSVRVSRAPGREMAGREIRPRFYEMAPGDAGAAPVESAELKRTFYAMDSGERAGSHDWEIDLCSVTLANFNYRKMTLVRDYAELGASARAHHNFDLLFSDEARRAFDSGPVRRGEDFSVLPSDPSQTEAVARAGAGESYVIQGPPGTGKSQTITNLIADYVARGKGVLFVCEKRAALDVVFHRLKQIGLGEVCALIHDSQGDKKAFIDELKSIYEAWLAKPPTEEAARHRASVVKEIAAKMAELERFSTAMTSPVEAGGPTLRELLEERLKRGVRAPRLTAAQKSGLPGWAALQSARPLLERLRDALISSGGNGVLARCPLRLLRGETASAAGAADRIERAVRRAQPLAAEAAPFVRELRTFLKRETLTWEEALAAGDFCQAIEPVSAADRMELLDPDSPPSRRLAAALEKLAGLDAKAASARTAAQGWAEDAGAPNLGHMIERAQHFEGRLFAFLSSDWRRARAFVRNGYAGAQASVALALRLLAEKLRAEHRRDEAQRSIEATFGFEPDSLIEGGIAQTLKRVWEGGESVSDLERDMIRASLERRDAAVAVLKMARLAGTLRRADDELGGFLLGHGKLEQAQIAANLEELAPNVGLIPELGDLLAELDEAGAEISQTLRLVNLTLEQLEIVALDAAIDRTLRRNRSLERFDGERLEDVVRKLQGLQASLWQVNGRYAVAACHKGFQTDVALGNAPTTGVPQFERERRGAFKRGRKTLENEFQKSRAYKSIRELFASEAGPVLRRLKPVWLMSPLSVADILPLEENLFDVVIFDEASQIPLEDAIPTLYRSQQMIVVGDEMQLPPSSFFSAQGDGEDDDQQPGLFVYDLNADSFLSRASTALPRTLLAWHYRSQHEALIEFCNKAFYRGQLQTIPSVAELPRREPMLVTAPRDAATLATAALEQPLSFHRMKNSPYGRQRNPGEAAYIAALTREILTSGKGLSIGVVAFSQAQQNEIERAIDDLAAADREFRTLLDLEEERQDAGQYVGLFVKNLENVQGDERDVIILSVCYGPDARGRMIMNFGPINQNGGEKRLNVIFSRAKKHMMVVSSIDGAQITNTYNYGANALRKYLIYAQAASTGGGDEMSAALVEYAVREGLAEDFEVGQTVADQIAEALRKRGFVAQRNLGRSGLKCHVAVRRAEDEAFRVAVQVDDREHYRNADLAARYVVRPSILSAFGWDVMTVLAKDWRANSKGVIERIAARM